MKEPSELVSLYLGKRSDTCPGAQRESAALDPTLVSSLTGEAASTQGKGKGYSSHTQTNSCSGNGAHCQGADLTDSRRCPMWDWLCAKEKVQGGF